MTTGLDYTGFVKQIATMAVVEEDNEAFLTVLPQAITYAENRICRDLDFLFTNVANTQHRLTGGNRYLSIPVGSFVVTNAINVITPVSAPSADAGVRVPLMAVTREFLDATCADPNKQAVPKYFAPFGNSSGSMTYVVGPIPDNPYNIELVGTIRPDSLSTANPTTFISTYMPELMIMAAMVYIAGYQRNFGATQANDPQMPINYETQYQGLLMGAMSEESRKKFEAAAWSSRPMTPTSTPTRG